MSRDLVPTFFSGFRFFDDDVFQMNQRFLNQMQNMEQEMARFENALTSRVSSQDDSCFHSWLNDLKSPLVHVEGGEKQLKLQYNLNEFNPEEIEVKVADQKLSVHAKHEEKSDNHSVFKQYNREFLLPKGVDQEAIKSSLSKDGVLTIEAPLPQKQVEGAKKIPIEYKK